MKEKIDPLTGRAAHKAVRQISRFSMQGQSSPPTFQYLRVPRVGNIIGGITLRLPSALTQTVQSSVLELYVAVRLDGVPLNVEVEVEDFYFEAEYE